MNELHEIPEFLEVFRRELSSLLERALLEYTGSRFACPVQTIRTVERFRDRRRSRSGLVPVFRIGADGEGYLMFPAEVFTEIVGHLTGYGTSIESSRPPQAISTVGKAMLADVCQLVVSVLAIATARSSATFHKGSYGYYPEMVFAGLRPFSSCDALARGESGATIIEIDVVGAVEHGAMTLVIPPLSAFLGLGDFSRFSAIREAGIWRQVLRKQHDWRHLSRGISRMLLQIEAKQVVDLIVNEEHGVTALFLRHASASLKREVIRTLSKERAASAIKHLARRRAPKPSALLAMHKVLSRYLTEAQIASEIEALLKMLPVEVREDVRLRTNHPTISIFDSTNQGRGSGSHHRLMT